MKLKRINKIRNIFKELDLDALFVTGPENVSYLTGISDLINAEREICLLISGKSLYLLAFSTSYLLYQNLPKTEIIELTVNRRLDRVLNDIIQKNNFKKIAFEKDYISYGELDFLQNKLNAELVPISGIIENLRVIKSEAEITKIRTAAQITDKAFSFILSRIKSGTTEKKLALIIEFFLKENAQNAAFSPIVAFNKNAAIPHYLPSDNVRLSDNSLVLIDMGAKYENYCADLTRVVFLGPPKKEIINIYQTVKKAQELALKSLKTGVSAESVDKICRDFISKSHLPAYKHGLGHGVGLSIHENPRLRPNIKTHLQPNMVFTIEPGIYIPGYTGVRIEDLLVLRNDGPELLSGSTRDIIIL